MFWHVDAYGALNQIKAMSARKQAEDFHDIATVARLAIDEVKNPRDLWDLIGQMADALDGAAKRIEELASDLERS